MIAPVPPADAYVPVDMRWRLVRAGDVVLDPNGAPWIVNGTLPPRGNRTSMIAALVRTSGVHEAQRDPDATVRVLVPWPEAAGIVMLREGLGPVRVLDRGEVA